MAHVTIVGDCGQIGNGKQGETWPNGVAVPGTNQAKSHVTINGVWAIDLPPDDSFVALVLHELSHALQNFQGRGIGLTDVVDLATHYVNTEVIAYGAIWDLVVAGDLRLTNRQKCAEIADSVKAMVARFEKLAEAMTQAGVNPNAGQRAAIRQLRTDIRNVLLKYQTFLAGMPAGAPHVEFPPCDRPPGESQGRRGSSA